MEVLIGEIPGERFAAYLLIEDESADYDRNREKPTDLTGI